MPKRAQNNKFLGRIRQQYQYLITQTTGKGYYYFKTKTNGVYEYPEFFDPKLMAVFRVWNLLNGNTANGYSSMSLYSKYNKGLRERRAQLASTLIKGPGKNGDIVKFAGKEWKSLDPSEQLNYQFLLEFIRDQLVGPLVKRLETNGGIITSEDEIFDKIKGIGDTSFMRCAQDSSYKFEIKVEKINKVDREEKNDEYSIPRFPIIIQELGESGEGKNNNDTTFFSTPFTVETVIKEGRKSLSRKEKSSKEKANSGRRSKKKKVPSNNEREVVRKIVPPSTSVLTTEKSGINITGNRISTVS